MEIPKIDKSHYKSIVYISHPFQNNPENVKEIEDIIKGLHKCFPNYLFISPVHAFGFLYDSTTYEQGLYMTLFLLETCAMISAAIGFFTAILCVAAKDKADEIDNDNIYTITATEEFPLGGSIESFEYEEDKE